MRVVFIGAGRLATQLAKALKQGGHEVTQVYSRTMASASMLANQLGCEAVNEVGQVVSDADVYIVAVKDAALAELIPQLCRDGRERQVWLHTAGSMPMALFAGHAAHYGVFYPMQTFSKECAVDFRNIYCFLEANDSRAMSCAHALAESVSPHVVELSSEGRRYLHLAAVFACNFANHCYALSAEILAKQGLPFDAMLPLIDETARKVHELSPAKAQTGPAVRYDENVLKAQSQLLSDRPDLQELYDRMSKSIYQTAKQQ